MLLRCAAVILGGTSPLEVDTTSSAAAAFGLEVPMPTWALIVKPTSIAKIVVTCFIILNLCLKVKKK